MPKGVDHCHTRVTPAAGNGVQKSLMPKGVDHAEEVSFLFSTCSVQKSLMPKGVDHILCDWLTGDSSIGAKIFDAERR